MRKKAATGSIRREEKKPALQGRGLSSRDCRFMPTGEGACAMTDSDQSPGDPAGDRSWFAENRPEQSGLLICVPGPWKDREEFLIQVIELEPAGRYVSMGGLLVDLEEKDHVILDFSPADPGMLRAFTIAGQGRIPQETLDRIQEHSSFVFMHFPLDIRAQRDRVVKFTKLLPRLGGMAVKIDSAGIAHTWERWFKLLNGSLFDLYCSTVVLIGGHEHYFSCGMHHFGLPESALPTSIPVEAAADLMNRFNFWRIADAPHLNSGETFSLSQDDPHYRLTLKADSEHEAGEPFFNAHGVWFLSAV